MGVPFERLGPGQVGRLAYQVIGKDGPILNPNNIRYLEPGAVEGSESASVAEYGLGVSCLNLLASVTNTALSVQILSEVRRARAELQGVASSVERIERIVEDILRRVERIDTKVQENNLRHAMTHVFRAAVSDEGIDLRRLAELHGDLTEFGRSLDAPLFLNFAIRLSTDVRDNLSALCELLLDLRSFVAWHHNASVGGNPLSVVHLAPVTEYLGADIANDVRGALVYNSVVDSFGTLCKDVYESLQSRFTWYDEEDQEHFSNVLSGSFAHPLDAAFSQALPASVTVSQALPDSVLDPSDIERSVSDAIDIAVEWLWQTDGGLLYRAHQETSALAHGYENVFWPHLRGEEANGVDRLEGVCDL